MYIEIRRINLTQQIMYTSTWFQTQLTTCIVQTETGVKDSEDTYISHDCFYNAMNSGGGCESGWMWLLCVDVCDSVCLSYGSLRLGFGLTPLHHVEVAV